MNPIDHTIKDSVAETLYIPLYMKRNETNRKNAFFSDPKSCELVESINYDFSKYDRAPRSSVGCAIRAGHLDKETADFIQKNDNPVIVHVGCGLDTRYHRIGKELAKKAVFYELDIPEAIELRQKVLPPSENDIYLKGSMFETDWMDEIAKKHPDGSFLFVVEGVFMYFEKDEVKKVFTDFADRFSGAHILFDVTSFWMCKNSHKHDTVKFTNASFKLEMDDDKEIETWADNLKFISVWFYSDFPEWKRAGFMNYWTMKLVKPIRYASRILYYRID